MSLVPVCALVAGGGGGQSAAGVWFCVSVAGSTQPRQSLGVWVGVQLFWELGKKGNFCQGAWSPS